MLKHSLVRYGVALLAALMGVPFLHESYGYAWVALGLIGAVIWLVRDPFRL